MSDKSQTKNCFSAPNIQLFNTNERIQKPKTHANLKLHEKETKDMHIC